MKIPLTKKLLQTFAYIEKSTYQGVDGVLELKNDPSLPIIGITICTHGNELCGLASAHFLIELHKKHKLKYPVFIVINNLEAAKRHVYDKTNFQNNNRFIDVNMNRLPQRLKRASKKKSEINRAQQLLSVWKKFDYSIDFHSTTQDCEAMLIDIHNNFPLHLSNGFNIKKIIKNIAQVQVGKPASYFYNKKGSITCSIECGQHYKKETFDFAKNITKEFLKNLNNEKSLKSDDEYEEFYIIDSIIFPNTSYYLVKEFKNFGKIKAGTVIARGDGQDLYSTITGHTLFAGKRMFKTKAEIKEEALFLSQPVKVSNN